MSDSALVYVVSTIGIAAVGYFGLLVYAVLIDLEAKRQKKRRTCPNCGLSSHMSESSVDCVPHLHCLSCGWRQRR